MCKRLAVKPHAACHVPFKNLLHNAEEPLPANHTSGKSSCRPAFAAQEQSIEAEELRRAGLHCTWQLTGDLASAPAHCWPVLLKVMVFWKRRQVAWSR